MGNLYFLLISPVSLKLLKKISLFKNKNKYTLKMKSRVIRTCCGLRTDWCFGWWDKKHTTSEHTTSAFLHPIYKSQPDRQWLGFSPAQLVQGRTRGICHFLTMISGMSLQQAGQFSSSVKTNMKSPMWGSVVNLQTHTNMKCYCRTIPKSTVALCISMCI